MADITTHKRDHLGITANILQSWKSGDEAEKSLWRYVGIVLPSNCDYPEKEPLVILEILSAMGFVSSSVHTYYVPGLAPLYEQTA